MTDAVLGFSGAYSWLSNFYPSPVVMHGVRYPTVEHAYQAAKTEDLGERRAILLLPTPGQAKRAGRKLKMRRDWEAVKVGYMLALLRSKFEDPELAEKLMATGGLELIEANTWGDTFWGVCGGVGENILGKLLMQVRRELYEGE